MKTMILAVLLLLGGCTATTTLSGLDPAAFDAEIDGRQVALYTLTNDRGAEVCVTNFGGRIVSIMVPDRNGRMRDVVLGFDNIEDYRTRQSDFGAAIGRYANRIAGGRFVLDGDTIRLPQNNFGHCLHGGPKGWQYCVYDVEKVESNRIVLVMNSPDGDSQFPGAVTARVVYTLTDDNALDISYDAVTDRPTIINMTNHSYFCLSGYPAAGSMDDILYIAASRYTPVDSTFMTTGETVPTAGTPMDFTEPHRVGERIEQTSFEQLRNGRGYDHNWVLDSGGDINVCAARLCSPASGIVLEVFTDQPGIQVYSGNFLTGEDIGKGGIAYGRRASICLETQHYPDSPNKPQWPSVVLRPDQRYTARCIYRFSVDTITRP